MTQRQKLWNSTPFEGPGRHQLFITQDGLRVTRIVSWPGQPHRESEVMIYEAPDQEHADTRFNLWCEQVPGLGHRLVPTEGAEGTS